MGGVRCGYSFALIVFRRGNWMKWTRLPLLLAVMVLVLCVSTVDVAGAAGTDKAENAVALKVERLDSSADRIVPTDAKMERVATGLYMAGRSGVGERQPLLCRYPQQQHS